VAIALTAVAGALVRTRLDTDEGVDQGAPGREGGVQWSLFEDHAALIRSDADRRERTLRELKALGADTLRIAVKWNEVAPAPLASERPSFDATDPADYPGFAPYDDLTRRAVSKGFRIVMGLAPDAPRWATEGAPLVTPETVNLDPSAKEFGSFASAVARRYSGRYRDLPAVRYFSIWNEPNHELFLKPNEKSPQIYRGLVAAAVERMRRDGARNAQVLVGETAPAGRPGTVMGPREFIQRWLCLDRRFLALRGAAARRDACRRPRAVDADGYAHHPYGPARRVPKRRDLVSLLAIQRLGSYLDRAARAGRLPAELPIYSTEFGLQSNPPDPTVSTTLARQAQLLNEKEELSFRYPRLKSYAQYLLYDDPPRPGPPAVTWSGFQTGLRFTDGTAKPALAAYRLPIVVRRHERGVSIWGRVRPGTGTRFVRLERRSNGRFAGAAKRIPTDPGGYFEVTRRAVAGYRFRAWDDSERGGRYLGASRSAPPIP
jgi:hypothetical protein